MNKKNIISTINHIVELTNKGKNEIKLSNNLDYNIEDLQIITEEIRKSGWWTTFKIARNAVHIEWHKSKPIFSLKKWFPPIKRNLEVAVKEKIFENYI